MDCNLSGCLKKLAWMKAFCKVVRINKLIQDLFHKLSRSFRVKSSILSCLKWGVGWLALQEKEDWVTPGTFFCLWVSKLPKWNLALWWHRWGRTGYLYRQFLLSLLLNFFLLSCYSLMHIKWNWFLFILSCVLFSFLIDILWDHREVT